MHYTYSEHPGNSKVMSWQQHIGYYNTQAQWVMQGQAPLYIFFREHNINVLLVLLNRITEVF